MSDDPLGKDGASIRGHADKLLDEALTEDPRFREAFLRSEAARQAKILARAVRSGDADVLRRLKVALEKIRDRMSRR